MRIRSNALIVFLTCAFAWSSAQATENEWNYSLTLYLWFAGLEGDVATVPPLPPSPIDVSSSDALSDTESSLMMNFSAKKNRHGLFFGLVYSDVQSEEEAIPPPIDLMMASTTKSTQINGAYQYEFYRNDSTVLDVLGGMRYWKVDSRLQFGGGLGILDGALVEHKESWVDPVVGIKSVTHFGSNKQFYLAGIAALGGFGAGSDFFYDVNANIGYRWNKSIGTAIGYRLYDVDYENRDFLYDVKQQGWLLSLTWEF